MRIFVAGQSGQVACSLRELATNRDDLTLHTAGRPDFDLTNPASVHAAIVHFQPDLVINAAAYTAVDGAENDEEAAFAVNATGTETLAKVSAMLDIPFLHISTDYVFDGTKKDAYVEDDPAGPTGVYGRSKLRGEILALEANPKTAIFRTAWVYSPFGKNFLKTMLKLAESREELGVVADQIGNPTYAPDIAEALVAVASKIGQTGWQDSYGGIFHMVGSDDTSWYGFAETIFDAGARLGHPRPTVNAITTAEYPTPAKRPANSRLNCDKLAATFDVRLPDWQESTLKCVNRLFDDNQLG